MTAYFVKLMVRLGLARSGAPALEEPPSGGGARPWRPLVNIKRLLVLSGAVLAVYFAVGSWMFPGWFFALFWRAKFWDGDYWMDGLFYWFDFRLITLVIATVVFFVLTLCAYALRRRFLPYIDRFALRLTIGCVLLIWITALLDYKYGRGSYDMQERLGVALNNLKSAFETLTDLAKTPTIKTPIDFRYLDRIRVEALYSQIEPELIESRRTVVSSAKTSGKAGATIGPINGELGAANEKGATSSFERSKFSTDRKCVEVMNFLLEHKKAHYYTTGGGWFIARLARKADEDLRSAQEHPSSEVTKEDFEKLRTFSLDRQETKEERQQSARRVQQYSDEFEAEMKSLTDQAVLDAEFTIRPSPDGNLFLTEEFSEKPLHIVMRVSVPQTKESVGLASKSKSHLRVFGTVTEPLTKEGVIDIRALALF